MLKIDDIIFFSEGSYSDYSIYGHAKVLKDFDYEHERSEYIDENPNKEVPVPEEWKKNPYWNCKTTYTVVPRSVSAFMLHLIKRGLIEEINVTEFYEDF